MTVKGRDDLVFPGFCFSRKYELRWCNKADDWFCGYSDHFQAFVCIWLMSGLLVFPPFVGWSRFIREGLNTSCSWDYASRTWNNRSYYIYLLFFGFVVPVTAVIVSYVGILIVICQHSSEMNGVTRNGIIHSKKRPTKSDLRTAQVSPHIPLHVTSKILIRFFIFWSRKKIPLLEVMKRMWGLFCCSCGPCCWMNSSAWEFGMKHENYVQGRCAIASCTICMLEGYI